MAKSFSTIFSKLSKNVFRFFITLGSNKISYYFFEKKRLLLFLISSDTGIMFRIEISNTQGFWSDICAMRAGIPAVQCPIVWCPLIDNRHYRSMWGHDISAATFRLSKGENVEGTRRGVSRPVMTRNFRESS